MSDESLNTHPASPPEIPSVPGASPSQGDWLHEPGIPFWKPTWFDSLKYMKWRWLVFGSALLGSLIFLFVPIWFGFFQLTIFGGKLLFFAIALPFSSLAYAMRSAVQARREPFCIHCGYSLIGLPDHHHCPECGRPYSFQLIDEYRRDPDWFIQRCREHRQLPQPHAAFAAGQFRSKRKSRDGT